MNKLISFVKEFTKEEVKELNSTEKLGRRYFYMTPELKELKDRIPAEPYSEGLPLGELKNNKFVPSISLLDILSKYSDRKIFVNKKGETVFLYSREIYEENIDKSNVDEGMCLVLNDRNEVLGYGELIKKGKQKLVMNYLDRGDFLRRERTEKS